ncbi:MAG TPA: asparagine synthase (glutamine-hydrolyzing) [Chloroflexi bacterium]|nr:asparagine synthase (glutamine-hydrolyzing) [Chloroflexota bacterium]
MCGITGIWQLDGAPVDLSVLQAMTEAIAHRGPDGEGLKIAGAIGLGHRRLAILDLSPAGHQPMSYANGRYWITYNGEVYNFLELRHELEQLGHHFSSHSDTEVILAAYAQWGRNCLLRFNGMWAFAIWDAQEQTLFLARDRFGVKPLFYLLERDRIAFASEWKAFFSLPSFVRRIDWSTFLTALLNPYSQEGIEQCLLVGIRRLLPGHCMEVTPHVVRVYRWWQTLDHLQTPPTGLRAQAAHFLELFTDACRLRMRSDVPIGTCLSGGLDSSAIVCTLAAIGRQASQGGERLAQDWQRAFIATFPGAAVDERNYAELVVQATAVTPEYVTPTAADFLAHIDSAVYHLEGLDAGPTIQLWALYRRLRASGVVVTLDGHGGDELLGGYVSHVRHALYDAGRLRQWPGRYLQMLNTYRAMFRNASDSMRPPSSLQDLVIATNSWAQLAARLGRSLTGNDKADLSPAATGLAQFLHPDLLGLAPTPEPPYIWPGNGHLEAALYREFHQTMLPTILRNYDRMAMAHGVEVRMPFMDWRLVTYVFSLPPESKIGQGFTKLVLREAMRGLLPEAVRTRRDKIGFAPPVVQWFQGELKQWLLDGLCTMNHAGRVPLLSDPAQRKVCADIQRNQYTWNELITIWPLIHARLWLAKFAAT